MRFLRIFRKRSQELKSNSVFIQKPMSFNIKAIASTVYPDKVLTFNEFQSRINSCVSKSYGVDR